VVESRDRKTSRRDVPSYIYLPNRLGHIQGYDRLGQYAGWLGRAYNALATEVRKRGPGDNPYFRPCTEEELAFRVEGLDARAEITLDRLDSRRRLGEQFDRERPRLDSSAERLF